MNALHRSITEPLASRAQRLPTFPSVERTAVMQFTAPTRTTVEASDTRVMVCNQAAYPVWTDYKTVYFGGTFITSLSYLSKNNDPDSPYFYNEPAAGTAIPQGAIAPTWNPDGSSSTAGQPGLGSTSTYDPYVISPIIGMDRSVTPNPFLYVVQPTTSLFVAVQFAAATTGLQVSIELEVWIGTGVAKRMRFSSTGSADFNVLFQKTQFNLLGATPIWVRPVSVNIGNAGSAPAISAPVVYMFSTAQNYASSSFIGSTTQATTTIDIASGTGGFRSFLPNPVPIDFYYTAIPWGDTKVTAVGVEATNVTKVLNREGVVMCGRVNPVTKYLWNVGASDLASLHPSEKVQLPMEKTIRTYVLASAELGEFTDYTYPVSTAVYNPVTLVGAASYLPVFNLSSNAFANFMVFQDPDGGSSISLRSALHIEFKSNTVLWPISISRVKMEVFHQAISRAAQGPFFRAGAAGKNLQDVMLGGSRKPPTNKRSKAKQSKQSKSRARGPPPVQYGTVAALPPAYILPPSEKKKKLRGGLSIFMEQQRKAQK